jgi:cell division protein FtsL
VSRLNFLLLLIVVSCALSVVSATNRQRELFIALGRGQMQERQLQQELARLQYQQSALSKTTRVEGVATSDLKMQPVTAGRTQYLTVAGASTTAADDVTSGPVPTSSSTGASGASGASAASAALPGASR